MRASYAQNPENERSPAVAPKSRGGKTIAIDCRFAASQSGLGRYTRELVTRLLTRPGDFRYTLLVRSKNESWIPELKSGNHVVEANIGHYTLQEQLLLPTIIRDTCADLLFSPHFNIPLNCPIPFVVTIHDFILHKYPNNAPLLKRLMYRRVMGSTVRRATHIIAISNFVRSEITDEYGSDIGKKVTVVREGVSDHYHPVHDFLIERVRNKYGLPHPFLLYVGNAKQHKNVRMLLDAFKNATQNGHDLVLVTGGDEAALLQPFPPRVRRIKSVEEADLPALYCAADAFVTASLYEGYCLPVAEALACGTPVIAVNGSAIPEIAAGHATLLEPKVAAFAEAMKEPHQRQTPIVVGRWEETAQQTEEVLASVLQRL